MIRLRDILEQTIKPPVRVDNTRVSDDYLYRPTQDDLNLGTTDSESTSPENSKESDKFISKLNQYNVFVSGLEGKWNGDDQLEYFNKGYTSGVPVKQFRYASNDYWKKEDDPQAAKAFIDFLNNENNTINKVILFSKGCEVANKAALRVGANKVYCIEPYVTTDNKSNWSMIPAENFYVNEKHDSRGKGAKEGIPDDNINKLNASGDHINALPVAVEKIFK